MRMLLVLAFLMIGAVLEASEIPAFARKYGVSCNLCHNPMPRLTAFGEQYAANGFRMVAREPIRDSVPTGDPLLDLSRELPIAFRLDAYVDAYANGRAVTDLKTPYNLKILAGGPISRDISYYLYFFLFERGEIGGVEDAFIYFNDIAGAPLDLAVGQFQVSDPMFKRELRLPVQDYAIYRARIGRQPADLTYDRGIMAIADVLGFTVTGIVVNGNGRHEAEADLRLDNDAFKNLLGHVTRDLTSGIRVGALGYFGRQSGSLNEGPEETNRLWMVGGDFTLSFGPLEVNGQYIHREDDLPTFSAGETKVRTDGGFVEAILSPPRSRWYGLALYNYVDSDRPLLNVRLGGPSNVLRYQTLTAGGGYLLRRNFRLFAEGTWDLEDKNTRWTLGLSTAF